MNIYRLTCFFCILGTAVTALAGDLTNYPYFRKLTWTGDGDRKFVSVDLDSDIYHTMALDFADLRIFDSQGHDRPYLLRAATEQSERFKRHSMPGEIVALQEREDQIEIDVKLPGGTLAVEEIQIVTPLKNYERRVTILGLAEGNEPQALVSDGLLFDYSRYARVANQTIAIPKSQFAAFRLVIKQVDDTQVARLTELTRKLRGGEEIESMERTVLERRPFRVDEVTFWGTEKYLKVGPKLTVYPTSHFRLEVDPETKNSIVAFSMVQQPCTALTFQTTQHNFNRPVMVQIQEQRGTVIDWLTIAQRTITDYNFSGFKQSSLTVTIPEQRATNYRVLIENQDNPPLEITGVQASGPVYQAIFLAEADQSYRLAYGSPASSPPRYDTSAIALALSRGVEPLIGTLAKPESNPQYTASSALRQPLMQFLTSPLAFMIAVLIMVLALAWALFQVTHRLQDTP